MEKCRAACCGLRYRRLLHSCSAAAVESIQAACSLERAVVAAARATGMVPLRRRATALRPGWICSNELPPNCHVLRLH